MRLSKITLVPALICSLAAGAFAADDEEETPLAEAMDEISGSLKGLRRARDFNAKAELAREGQAGTIKSLAYLPALIEKMPDGAEKTKAVADYKRLMGLVLVGLADLELAFLAEDEAKAEEIVDHLKDLKKEGHEKYEEE